jgi:hypothetical protein
MSQLNDKIRPRLENMKVGDIITFSIHRLKSVRTQASELGAILQRRYKTSTDRDSRTITVVRYQ